MQGFVTRDLEPRIPLTIYFPDGTQENVSALVDTGFSGELVVTDAIAQRLTRLRSVQTMTADAFLTNQTAIAPASAGIVSAEMFLPFKWERKFLLAWNSSSRKRLPWKPFTTGASK